MMSRLRVKVSEKTTESRSIVSLKLAVSSQDWEAFANARGGQFVNVSLDVSGSDRKLIRSYSISRRWDAERAIRISVRREDLGADNSRGIGSNFIHDAVLVGQDIEVSGPAGRFCLDSEDSRPAIFLGAGVGVTPLLGMIHDAVAAGPRSLHLLQSFRCAAEHAFREEVQALADQNQQLAVHTFYSQPGPEERAQGAGYSSGRMDVNRVLDIVGGAEGDFYVCGPTGFIEDTVRQLGIAGVDPDRIRLEQFASEVRGPNSETMSPAPIETAGDKPVVSFAKSGVKAEWVPDAQTLLDFAERNGLQPNFSCRAGICNECRHAVLEGSVKYIVEPVDDPEDGYVLLCCCVPDGDITIDL